MKPERSSTQAVVGVRELVLWSRVLLKTDQIVVRSVTAQVLMGSPLVEATHCKRDLGTFMWGVGAPGPDFASRPRDFRPSDLFTSSEDSPSFPG